MALLHRLATFLLGPIHASDNLALFTTTLVFLIRMFDVRHNLNAPTMRPPSDTETRAR